MGAGVSGIVGLWNLDGQPVDRKLLEKMSATIAHRGPDGENIWIQDNVGVAFQHLHITPESLGEVQPVLDRFGAAVTFDGRLDNRDELLDDSRIGALASRRSGDAVLVSAAYRVFGDEFPVHLKGDFAIAIYDARDRRLYLARDAMGVRPLYYWRTQKVFIFASEIKAILAHPDALFKPNDSILAESLFLGAPTWNRWDQTLFEGVLRVHRGQLASASESGVTLRQYWDFDPYRQTRFPNQGQYSEAFLEHFTRAVTRQLRSARPVAVLVSGGVDSSAVYATAQTLVRVGPGGEFVRGWHHTYPEGTAAYEQQYLKCLEERYGRPIVRLAPQRPFSEGLHDQLWHGESPQIIWDWGAFRQYRLAGVDVGARALLGGGWADLVVSQETYVADLVRSMRLWTAVQHVEESCRWRRDVAPRILRRDAIEAVARAILPSSAARRIRSRLGRNRRAETIRTNPWFTERLFSCVRSESGRGLSVAPFTSVYSRDFYDRLTSRHYQFTLEWANKAAASQGMEMWFPFLDRDLLSFMLSIPGTAQCPAGVPKGILRTALRDILPAAIANRRSKADFKDVAYAQLTDCYGDVRRLFETHPRTVAAGYVKDPRTTRWIDDLESKVKMHQLSNTKQMTSLAGLEMWLRVFGENWRAPVA